jgi:hypothetical protein
VCLLPAHWIGTARGEQAFASSSGPNFDPSDGVAGHEMVLVELFDVVTLDAGWELREGMNEVN